MSPCCCGILLGVLVIVFAWWDVSWANIALTVLGALLVIKSLFGACCCKTMCESMCKKQDESPQQE
ncbi:MAG: hypothetical protein ACYTEN_02575 [Planctomycetota bacterium]|jgi:hypothetical protein